MSGRKRPRRSRKRRGLPPGQSGPRLGSYREYDDGFPESWIDWLFFGVLFPLLALTAIWYGSQSIGPAYQARFGSGAAGVFTAQHESCGKTCFWTGTFRANSGYVRREVGLASGHGPDHVGDKVSALDTGDSKNVFPRGGGWDWLLLSAMLPVALAYLAVCARWLLRRRADRF
jgi:hypothetical protein